MFIYASKIIINNFKKSTTRSKLYLLKLGLFIMIDNDRKQVMDFGLRHIGSINE